MLFFPITHYLYSCYRNPSNSKSLMLRDDAGSWSIKKFAVLSLGACLELAPCVLITATIASAIFSGMMGNVLVLACMTCVSCVVSLVISNIFRQTFSNELSKKYEKEFIEKYIRILKKDDEALLELINSSVLLTYNGMRIDYDVQGEWRVWRIPQENPQKNVTFYQNKILLELAERDQGRMGVFTNANVLPSDIRNIPGIVKIIQAYAETFVPATLLPIITKLRNFGHIGIKDQLLHKYICDPRDSILKNIQEQVELITALSDKEEINSKLRCLYQFHREQSNHAELQGIIRAYSKVKLNEFGVFDKLDERYLKTDLYGLDKIFYRLLILEHPPALDRDPDYW